MALKGGDKTPASTVPPFIAVRIFEVVPVPRKATSRSGVKPFLLSRKRASVSVEDPIAVIPMVFFLSSAIDLISGLAISQNEGLIVRNPTTFALLSMTSIGWVRIPTLSRPARGLWARMDTKSSHPQLIQRFSQQAKIDDLADGHRFLHLLIFACSLDVGFEHPFRNYSIQAHALGVDVVGGLSDFWFKFEPVSDHAHAFRFVASYKILRLQKRAQH